MRHICGIVINDIKRKDAGTWRCHLDLEDEISGQKEYEIQEYSFDVAKNPRPSTGSLCTSSDEADEDESKIVLIPFIIHCEFSTYLV